MHVLTDGEAQKLIASALADLPRVVLGTIAWTPGHIGQVVRRVQKWFPSTDSVRERVAELVEGFEQRGDVERGKGGVLRCLPAHVMEDALTLSDVPLYGNPAPERDLCSERGTTVIYQLEGTDPVRFLRSSTPLSAERLMALGVTVFSRQAIVDRIPAVMNLPWPRSAQFDPAPYRDGKWEAYDPQARPAPYPEGRWVEAGKLPTVRSKLVRFTPKGAEGDLDRQYYLHNGAARLLEISRDEARYRQFAIDREVRIPCEWRYERAQGQLVVNGMLPATVARALRYLTAGPVKRDKFTTRYPIPPESRVAILSISERLGTQLT